MTTWAEMLDIIKRSKKDLEKGQVHLDAGSLVTLLFSGGFDEMFGGSLDVEGYREKALELKKALGSKAADKKAAKHESYGIEDIHSDIILHLWRNQSNPIYSFDWLELLRDDVLKTGFQEFKSPIIPFIKYTHKDTRRQDLWTSWGGMANNPKASTSYLLDPSRTPAIIGAVTDVKKFSYAGGSKEAMRFKVFTGHDHSESITCWPDKGSDRINLITRERLVEGAVGIAVLRLSMWNDKLSPNLIEWHLLKAPIKKKKSGS